MSGSLGGQFRIAGVAFLRVDGRQYALRGNLVISIDAFEREGVAGQDGVHGFIERAFIPYIEGDFSDIAGLSLSDFGAMRNVTVQADLANGKSYILRNAWSSTARELNTADGQVTVRFEGMRGEETT